jgi:hypothetical protein
VRAAMINSGLRVSARAQACSEAHRKAALDGLADFATSFGKPSRPHSTNPEGHIGVGDRAYIGEGSATPRLSITVVRGGAKRRAATAIRSSILPGSARRSPQQVRWSGNMPDITERREDRAVFAER